MILIEGTMRNKKGLHDFFPPTSGFGLMREIRTCASQVPQFSACSAPVVIFNEDLIYDSYRGANAEQKMLY